MISCWLSACDSCILFVLPRVVYISILLHYTLCFFFVHPSAWRNCTIQIYRTLHLSAVSLISRLALPSILPFAPDEIHSEILVAGSVEVQDEIMKMRITISAIRLSTLSDSVGSGEVQTKAAKRAGGRQGTQKTERNRSRYRRSRRIWTSRQSIHISYSRCHQSNYRTLGLFMTPILMVGHICIR